MIKIFDKMKDKIFKTRKKNISVVNIKEKLGGEFIEFDMSSMSKINPLILGNIQSGSEHGMKVMIVDKAIQGESFIVVDSPCGEIEDLAKKINVDYKVSTDYGDKRIIFNPNSVVENDANFNKSFFKEFNKVLIVGNLGSFAYPVFRWVIWNTVNDTNNYLWFDEHDNDDFIYGQLCKQKKNNIDVVYDDSFHFKNIAKYSGVFINALNRFSFIDQTSEFINPVVLRVGIDEIEEYSLSELKNMFDLIIIANPKNYEVGKRKIMKLLGSWDEIEKFQERNEAILIYQDNIKHTEILFPKEFSFSR